LGKKLKKRDYGVTTPNSSFKIFLGIGGRVFYP